MGPQPRLPLCAGRLGNTVHKRLPQLIKDTRNHPRKRFRRNGLPNFKANTLMHMHVKRGSVVDARHVFDNMRERDVVSWNIMILGYAKQEEGARALELYALMHQEGVQPTDRTFVGALKSITNLAPFEKEKQFETNSANIGCLNKGRCIHSRVLNKGLDSNVFVGTSLVDMYAKCQSMEDARRVFDELPHRNMVTWTIMILGYAQHEEGAQALELYAQLHQEGFTTDLHHRIFVGALKACSNLAALEEGTQVDGKFVKIGCLDKGRVIHSQVIKSGFESHLFVGTTMVDMYAKCGSMEEARFVFDDLPQRDVVSWNAMILEYSKQEEGVSALDLYRQMQHEGVQPNARTFVGVLKACSNLAALEEEKQADVKFAKIGYLQKGRAIHSQVAMSGLNSEVYVGNSLVDVYSKCGSMEDARCVFDELPCCECDVVTWTTMILGYSKMEQGALALELYALMQVEGVMPDQRTFVVALKACSSMAALEEGKQADRKAVKIGGLKKGRSIHSDVVKSGFDAELFVGNILVDMYAKYKVMEDARCVFDELLHHDVVSWNTMILGYVDQGENEEAFVLYARMQDQGLPPNCFTFVAILQACGNKAALETGRELHSQISSAGFSTNAIVATSLIDMYAKCGSMVDAQQFFDGLLQRDVVPWNALIAGYSHEGESELVFHLFERMRQEGNAPNGVTFLSVLNACSHVGLVDKARKYFQAMSKQYGVVPSIEHYTCMIDLLGRAGQVDEAAAMVEKMPFQPDAVVWSAVLAACQKWKNIEIGRHAFENAVKLDEKLHSPYVAMANLYADAHAQDSDRI